MSHKSSPTSKSGKIAKHLRRLQATGLIVLSTVQGVSFSALADDASGNAAITIVLNQDTQLIDPKNPSHSLGSLTHGSQVTLALPASVAASLNGKTNLTSTELQGLLNGIGGPQATSGTGRQRRSTPLQNIAINLAEQYSTVDPKISAGALNLNDLLKNNGATLQPVQYNVASIATGPGETIIRGSASRPPPTGPAVTPPAAATDARNEARPDARPRVPVAPATRLQATTHCESCEAERVARLNRTETGNLGALRAVTRAAPTPTAQPAPRAATAARTPEVRPATRPAAPRETAAPAPAHSSGSLAQYSNSPAVKTMIAHALRKSGLRTQKSCYRFVKSALYAGGLLPNNALNGLVPAGHAAIDLGRHGWTNLATRNPSLLTNPYSAPVGSILVYRDLAGGYGHVEIRTPTGFVSDYRTPTSPYGRRFKIVGVMVPPGVSAN